MTKVPEVGLGIEAEVISSETEVTASPEIESTETEVTVTPEKEEEETDPGRDTAPEKGPGTDLETDLVVVATTAGDLLFPSNRGTEEKGEKLLLDQVHWKQLCLVLNTTGYLIMMNI